MQVADTLNAGAQVLAKLDGWSKHYPGMINRKHADGTYDIVFNDGDRASQVPRSCIILGGDSGKSYSGMSTTNDNNPEEQAYAKVPPPPSSPLNSMTEAEVAQVGSQVDDEQTKLAVGDSVEAKAPGWTSWYRGTVVNAHADGTVDVKFEDGDFKRGMTTYEVRNYYSDSPPSHLGRPAPVSAKKKKINQRSRRPQSAAPSRRAAASTSAASSRSNSSSAASDKRSKRPSTAPRSRHSRPAGRALSFAQWKRESATRLYGGSYGVGRHHPSTVPLMGTRSKRLPWSRGQTRDRGRDGTRTDQTPPPNLSEYLSTKVNPVLLRLSEQIYLDQPANLAMYLSDFAAKLAAQTIGSSSKVVRKISNALISSGTDREAASFFAPQDRDGTGALAFSSFLMGVESLQTLTGLVLSGDDVGRLFQDFDSGNGFIAYKKLCDLIESLRMTESVFQCRVSALIDAGKESGLDIKKLLSEYIEEGGEPASEDTNQNPDDAVTAKEDLYPNRAFLASWQDDEETNSTTITEMWNEIPKDVEDHVNVDELETALKRLGLSLPQGAAEEWHACMDSAGNSDGKVDFAEFAAVVGTLASLCAKQQESGHVDSEVSVFLGGSCNPTTWRKNIAIPILERAGVSYYNPQVDDWSEDLVALEAKHKQGAKVLLFVVNGSTRSIASMVEAAELIAAGRRIVLVLEDIPEGQKISEGIISGRELKDLNRARAYLADVAQRHSVLCFSSVITACLHTVRWCKRLGVTADDIGAQELASSLSASDIASQTPVGADSTPQLTVGTKVRARFAGKGHFYPARISKCNSDGTFDLEYMDGDWEEGAKLEHIVPI